MDSAGTAMARVVDQATGSGTRSERREISSAQTTRIEPNANGRYVVNRIEYLEATLPTRSTDRKAGQQRTAVYIKFLSGYSRDALTWMTDEVFKRHDWFPTVRQCLEILGEYVEPVEHRDDTLIEAQSRQAAFETWFANISDGQPIGDVEDRWIRIAIERGPIRRLEDGSLVLRALYQGPRLPAPVKL